VCFAALCACPVFAHAQVTIYTSEAQYLAAAGNVTFESFEGLTPRVRTTDPVTVAAFTVTPAPGLLGIQDGTDSPETGFGASAVDGTKYLFMYRPNLPAGTLRFDLTNPTNTFGFYITDVGETAGAVTFHTNAGESLTETTLVQYPQRSAMATCSSSESRKPRPSLNSS
jgi:hypothetical protein